MQIRDAHEGDVSAIVDLAVGDVDPQHLLRVRMVRVANEAGDGPAGGDEGDAIVGFLAFDARTDAVHVTRIGGTADAVHALLDDAIGFAKRENLSVEAVVPNGGSTAVALETKGFESGGSGPRFEGRETTRYRLDPT